MGFDSESPSTNGAFSSHVPFLMRQERMGQLDGRLSGEERKALEMELEDLLGRPPCLGTGDHSEPSWR